MKQTFNQVSDKVNNSKSYSEFRHHHVSAFWTLWFNIYMYHHEKWSVKQPEAFVLFWEQKQHVEFERQNTFFYNYHIPVNVKLYNIQGANTLHAVRHTH